jgi:hypothetical protein
LAAAGKEKVYAAPSSGMHSISSAAFVRADPEASLKLTATFCADIKPMLKSTIKISRNLMFFIIFLTFIS